MKGHWLCGCLWFCCGISCIVYGVTDSIDVQVSTEMAKTLKAGSITDANPQIGKSSVPGSSSGSSVGTTKDEDKSPIIILVLLSMLFFLVFLCRYCAASSDLEGPITEPLPEICDDPRSMKITIEELLEGTDNFSDKNILGKGGFGVVYRGQLRNGTMIAVKRWEEDISVKGREEEIPVKRREANSSKAFDAEINALTKIRHRHLVSLLGYCTDGGEKMLVYEYMPQGPLSQHLFEWEKAELRPLEWKQRLIIALDVAHGVQYLHNLAQDSFIHRDLKPSNVLLGDDMRAKISDFGLAKLARDGNFSVSNTIAGTYGYIAPEYAEEVTTKGDVYSFGVVLMELITGRRALDETQPHEFMHLATWFRRVIVDGVSGESFRKAVDPVLHMTDETFGSICKVADLARQCTAREPLQRPDMDHAVHVLFPLVAPFERTVSEDQSLGSLRWAWQTLIEGASSLEARTTHSYQARFRQTVQRTKCLY